MPVKILAVEDEPAIIDMVRFALERHGHTVYGVESVSEARALMANERMDIALVDWMLPGGSGLEFVRALRKDEISRQLPVIMLTARSEERDITAGLDAGADDYMTKPFSPRELHSRIQALLRRSQPFDTGQIVQLGPLQLDRAAHRLTFKDEEVALGHTEFKLISFLIQNPDRVYSRAQLLDHVWGPGTFIEERTVDVHILRLRKCLKPFHADTLLQTVRGAGYRFNAA